MAFENQVMWYKEQPQIKRFLIVLLLGVMVPAYYYLENIDALSEEITNAQTQLAAAKRKLGDAKRKAAVIGSLSDELKSTQTKLVAIKKLLPTDFQTEHVLERVATIASKHDLQVRSFVPLVSETEKPTDRYGKKVIKLLISGKFGNITSFFDKVTKLDQLTHLESLGYWHKVDVSGIKNYNNLPVEDRIEKAIRSSYISAQADLVVFKGVGL